MRFVDRIRWVLVAAAARTARAVETSRDIWRFLRHGDVEFGPTWDDNEAGPATPSAVEAKPTEPEPAKLVAATDNTGATLPNGLPATIENQRAFLRSQGVSELLGDGDAGQFSVALPQPRPLHPRAIDGDEIRVTEPVPLDGETLGILLCLAQPQYSRRRKEKPA